jgi:hypothetical protein
MEEGGFAGRPHLRLALLMVSVVNPVEADWLAGAWSSHKDGTPPLISSVPA